MQNSVIKSNAAAQGKSVGEYLKNIIEAEGGIAAAAKSLNVHISTISMWLARCGLKAESLGVRVVPDDRFKDRVC